MNAEQVASGVVGLATVYTGVGALLAMQLHLRGLRAIDPGVEKAGFVFRLLITPGLMLLWPFMLLRWLAVRRGTPVAPPYERPLTAGSLRTIHRLATRALVVIAPLVVVAALWAREPAPRPSPSVLPSEMVTPAQVPPMRDLYPTGDLPMELRWDSDTRTLYYRERDLIYKIEKDVITKPGLAAYYKVGSQEPQLIGPLESQPTTPPGSYRTLRFPPSDTGGGTILIASSVTGEVYMEAILP